MYDPMIAKLIVWDADREQATARMVRALSEYEIGGLKTLLPFHTAILQTEQWANAETCRDLIEDKSGSRRSRSRHRNPPLPMRTSRVRRSSRATPSRCRASVSRLG